MTEVTERENTTATDFFVVGTKTIDLRESLKVMLNLGEKLTNASILGIAANSPGWEFKPFAGASFLVDMPMHGKLTLGAEIARQSRELKEVPGPVVPSTLGYFARWCAGRNVPVTMDLGMMQLGGSLAPGFHLQSRHQLVTGAEYRF